MLPAVFEAEAHVNKHVCRNWNETSVLQVGGFTHERLVTGVSGIDEKMVEKKDGLGLETAAWLVALH